MRRQLGHVALATGVLVSIGVGMWNAIEIRLLREQLATKPMEPPVVGPAMTIPDMVVPKELTVTPLPLVTVEPPDILRIDVKSVEKLTQPVRGEFLIRPDGTIHLGTYGSLNVAGMTLQQVKTSLTEHLKKQSLTGFTGALIVTVPEIASART